MLFGPHPRITVIEDRRGARLFAMLMLLEIAAVTVLLFVTNFVYERLAHRSVWNGTDAWVIIGAGLLILVAYAILRAGFYRPGALLYIAATAAPPLIAPFVPDPNAEIGLLALAVIPIFLASLAFSSRWVLGVLGAIVAVATLRLVFTPLPLTRVGTGYALIVILVVVAFLVLIFRGHFSRLEKDRLAQIHRNEEALAQSEGRLRALMANSMDMIMVVDAHSRPRLVFGAYERLMGYTAPELLAASRPEGIHPEDAAQLDGVLGRLALHPGATGRAEWRQMHKDGQWRRLEAVASNCLHVPGIDGIVVNIRDVTERSEAEMALRQASKMETVGTLAGGIAHDFNNLLTAVLGNVNLMEEELDPGHPVQEFIAEIKKASLSAAALTRRLLAFSRRQVIEAHVVNLNDLIPSIELMLSRLVGETIALRTVLAADLGTVRADPSQVEQILVNLVVNARDAMPGGGTVSIETANVTVGEDAAPGRPGTPPGDYVELSVSDTGTGMSEEVIRHAFEPFFTTKPLGRGTGLGLATVYSAVMQSGAHIRLDSAPGKGTTCSIWFPRTGEPVEVVVPQPESDDTPGGTETVLLVEDETPVRELARRTLQRLGYRVLPAGSGEEAVRVAEAHPETVHLLFTDLVMPGMNGRQLSQIVQARHPETRVLFSSGYSQDVISRHGVLEEGVAFLPKPYSVADLAQRVRAVLDGPQAGPRLDSLRAGPRLDGLRAGPGKEI